MRVPPKTSWTSEYRVGDRVLVLHRPNEWCNGTVVGIGSGGLAVCHDEYNDRFHDCDGLCEYGHGYWYFAPNLVRLVETVPMVNLNLEEGLL